MWKIKLPVELAQQGTYKRVYEVQRWYIARLDASGDPVDPAAVWFGRETLTKQEIQPDS